MSKYYLSPKVVFTEEILSSNKPNSAPIVCILGSASRGPEDFTLIPNLKTLLTTYGTPNPSDLGLQAAAYLLQSDCQVLFGRTIPYGAKKAEVKHVGKKAFPWKIEWKSGASTEENHTYNIKVGFSNVNSDGAPISATVKVIDVTATTPVEKETRTYTNLGGYDTADPTKLIKAIAEKVNASAVEGDTTSGSALIKLTVLESSTSAKYLVDKEYMYYLSPDSTWTVDKTIWSEAEGKELKHGASNVFVDVSKDAFPWVFTWKEYGSYSNNYSITVGTRNPSNPLDLTYQLRDEDNVILETFSSLCYQSYVANQAKEDYDEYELANYISKNSSYVTCELLSPDLAQGPLPTIYAYYIDGISSIPSIEGVTFSKAEKKNFTDGNIGQSVTVKAVTTTLPDVETKPERGVIYQQTDGSYIVYLPENPYSSKTVEDLNINIKDIYALAPSKLEGLADTDALIYDFLLIPGLNKQLLQLYAVAQVDSRGDALYLPDLPAECFTKTKLYYTTKDGTTVEESDLKAFRELIQKLRDDDDGSSGFYNSRRVALYYPNCTIRSNVTGKQVHMPASVLGCFSHIKAYENTGYIWTPGAGYSDQGAVLENVLSMDYPTPIKIRDGLMSCSVNAIAYQVGVGYYISGNETAFIDDEYADYSSLFCSLSISKTINAIRRNVGRISKNFLYKPNTSATWASWVSSVSTYLDTIVVGNGLEKYRVVMDSTTVSEDDIKNHTAPGIIYIKPYRVIEYIPISVALTEDDFYFESEEGEV